MKDIRPFERIIAEQVSDSLRDKTRLSILSWNAGLRTGKETHNVVGSYHVIPLQEAESHFLDNAEIAAEQFHIYQVADHLLVFQQKVSFELHGVKLMK